jgi:hypothetical protein
MSRNKLIVKITNTLLIQNNQLGNHFFSLLSKCKHITNKLTILLRTAKKVSFLLFISFLAGVAGFEPTIKESKSFALPLGYTPRKLLFFHCPLLVNFIFG